MSSLLSEPDAAAALKGCQTPRILSLPPRGATGWGQRFIRFCAEVGVTLDRWQQLILELGLAERTKDRWAAFEVGQVVPRQNGKGDVLMARELGGLFLLAEAMLHTAHEFKTCSEAFVRIAEVIEASPVLRKRVKYIHTSNGKEAIKLDNEAELRFVARSAGSGRGFTSDLVVLDEAQILTDDPVRAIFPTLSARPNPQIWYAGTAGTEMSVHLGRVRRRAINGDDPFLAYLEWSVDEESYDPANSADWAKANPALGIRISPDYVASERAAMSAEGFASERLGVGKWPSDEGHEVISAEKWTQCAERGAERPEGPVVFAVDVSPHRSFSAIAVAGRRVDGLLAVELAEHRQGVDWVVDRMVELVERWRPLAVIADHTTALNGPLEAAGVETTVPAVKEIAQAAAGFYDSVMDNTLRHPADPRLDAAVAGAKQRPLGDAWAWARRTSSCDITPLVAASFALWGFVKETANMGQPEVWML